MAFEKIPGVPGRCYRPEGCGRRKHPCRDCFSCGFCSPDRCALCLRQSRRRVPDEGDAERAAGKRDRPQGPQGVEGG